MRSIQKSAPGGLAEVTIPVQNKSGSTAPQGAFVEVYDHDGTNYLFQRPSSDNSETCYILKDELEDDAVGKAYERGITSPAYMLAAPASGDRVGAVDSQWYGQVDDGGNFVAVADEYVVGP